ncbi:hypothetical protein [Streptomyces lunaelactis]|uniref:hypothetical protein n=1 Tax=Streptomyces lunaelactis TaxID=1535768 RepID=UPI00158486F9|nr:hypothetical protein [Streptomyces lunaelactis]NUK26029.1 hypothetical protein [Streptomyces lunaelactis]
MPRRGEYRKSFPAPKPRAPEPGRIGIREVIAAEGNGDKAVVSIDPQSFTCTTVAAELADEWLELMTSATFSLGLARGFRRTVVDFCEHVDATVPRAAEASLALGDPDMHFAVTEWLRLLPSRYKTGSREPGWSAGRLRSLIARRIEHPDRKVAGHLNGWVKGALGLRRGQTEELDEFTRADKQKLVRAAWADRLATEARIRSGRALAVSGTDPAEGGWFVPANLLWAIFHGAWSCEEIAERLPRWADMPAALHDLLPADTPMNVGKRRLLRYLVRQLYPHNLDLHSYRILLMAATGRASEEVSALNEDDVEFGPRSVMIDFSKGRARAEMRQAFSVQNTDAVLHPSKPRLDAAEIIQGLLGLTRPLAERAGITPAPLFLKGAISTYSLTIRPFDGCMQQATLVDWMADHDVSVSGLVDIRRLRKSGKVEKAIAFKGRVSDIADDHSVETFHGHYAHGTTLRVIAGNVITAAQRRWFDQALNGPVVLSREAEQSLQEPGAAAALGLSAEDVEQLRAGQLDMGVTGCKNPFDAPYGRPGQLCPVAPTRCLECRNAFILPSNLPQLLLFAAHLDQLQLRLSPAHFHALWGQSRVNVRAAIAARTDAEIALARRQIADDGLTLQLPLASHVEFDS